VLESHHTMLHNVRIKQGRRGASPLAETTEHTLHQASLEFIAISSTTATTHLDLGSLQVGPSAMAVLADAALRKPHSRRLRQTPKFPRAYDHALIKVFPN